MTGGEEDEHRLRVFVCIGHYPEQDQCDRCADCTRDSKNKDCDKYRPVSVIPAKGTLMYEEAVFG